MKKFKAFLSEEKESNRHSAGIIAYQHRPAGLHVMLVHPGGPLWAKKDDGAWSIPKGLHGSAEPPHKAAQREFEEETGFKPKGKLVDLGKHKQPSGKVVSAYGLHSDFDVTKHRSNSFNMEWPPKSGKQQSFPEVDRAAWFHVDEARKKILKGQAPILDALVKHHEKMA